MNEKINIIIAKINRKIEYAVKEFYRNDKKWTNSHERRISEIDGMIDVLSILTEKDYIMTDDGIKEIERPTIKSQ